MELREVIGRRRSIRFLQPDKPVEREKIQRMLEAATLSSFWGNVRALRAVVIERATAAKEVLAALPKGSAIGGFQFHLAPVLIVWYLDWRALDEQGARLHELVDAGAVGVDAAASHQYLDAALIPFFMGAMESIKAGGMTEMDCGQGIAQATLMAFEQGLGTCLLGVPVQKKLRRALALPEQAKILVIQTVGYPAESPEAGGQRPRLPFEQLYFLNRYGDAFPRAPGVVEELKRDRMIQPPGPLPGRREELQALSQKLGLSTVFGDEVPEIMQHVMQEMTEP
jgi:nitroreductase